MARAEVLRLGVGGPVGSGKTALVDSLCKRMRERFEIAVVTNDIYTREDAEFLIRSQALPPERIRGVETGGCPHTAIREDASMNLAAIDGLHRGDDAIILFSECLQDPSIPQVDRRPGLSVAPQRGLDEFLRHAVRQLGRAPGTRHRPDPHRGLGGGRQLDARELMSGVAREIGDVGRMIGRQPQRADLVRETQPAEMFHGAGLGGVGLRVERGAGLGIHDQAAHAARPQFVREHQPAWPAPRDQHVDLEPDRLAHSRLRVVKHRMFPFSDSPARYLFRLPKQIAAHNSNRSRENPR